MATQIGINKKGAKMARHTSDQTTYKILSSGAWVRMSSKKSEVKESEHNNSVRRRNNKRL